MNMRNAYLNIVKKIYNELIKLFRSFVSVIPNTNPKRTELENMITEMEISLNKNTSLTKKNIKCM